MSNLPSVLIMQHHKMSFYLHYRHIVVTCSDIRNLKFLSSFFWQSHLLGSEAVCYGQLFHVETFCCIWKGFCACNRQIL